MQDPSDSDSTLFAVRNAFFLGAHAEVVAEAEDMDDLESPDMRMELECYVWRARLAMGDHEASGKRRRR